MTDEPQNTTEEMGATDQTDDAQTESENADARLDAVEQRVKDQQAILDGLKEHLGGDGDGIGPVATRRGVLTAGGILGLLGLGAGTASAAGDSPSGQVGTDSNPLNELYTAKLSGSDGSVKLGANLDTNGNEIQTTTGGLRIKTNDNGNLILDPGTSNKITVTNGPLARPTTAVSSATTINAGDYFVEGDTSSSGFTITLPSSPSTGEEHVIKKKNGSNTLTIDGNGNNVDGSTSVDLSNDNEAKKVMWDGSEWQTQSALGNIPSTLVTSNNSTTGLEVTDNGGAPNVIGGDVANNTLNNSPDGAVVLGGGISSNTVSGTQASVTGGNGNTASNNEAVVSGGFDNTASGIGSMIPGGYANTASGNYSFAAGRAADTNSNDGAFVVGDSSGTAVTAGAADEMRFQATGGFVIAPESNNSDALEVQDKDGNSLLGADTSNHKVQVFDGDASDSIDVSHDGTNGSLSTTTGDLQLSPSGAVDVQSAPLTRPLASHSSDTTINSGDYFVEADTSSNSVTITLPSSPSTGEEHVIKKKNGSNTLTIDGNGDNIDGSSQISLRNDNDAKKVVYDGSEWQTQSEIGSGGSSSSKLETSTNSVTAMQVLDGNSSVSESTDSATPPIVIGGHPSNNTGGSSVKSVTIFGGGNSGGNNNEANVASDDWTAVLGGLANSNAGFASTICGGRFNSVQDSAGDGAIGGGGWNVISGYAGTVPGGYSNQADKQSFAAGHYAAATDSNSFVWNDKSNYHNIPQESTDGLNSSNAVNGEGVTGTNTFSVSAQGGVRFITGSSQVVYTTDASAGWSTTSTRTAKTNIEPVEPSEVLASVEEMVVSTWEYRDDDGEGKGVRHMGPTAEQFHGAFDLGESEIHINSMNLDGAALGAIKGLSQELDEAREDLDDKDERIDDLEAENEHLHERNAELEDRLATVEAELGIDATASQQGVDDD